MKKVKRCPACHKEAEIVEQVTRYFDGDHLKITHWIECTHCDIKIETFDDVNDAINSWNTRL